ncbi:MAG: PAS domain S-box protein [Bacillus sp. (in: Bacteria)]|nr:PAS domain S-box protein [Bacillus sp. (in: firmicutes)]
MAKKGVVQQFEVKAVNKMDQELYFDVMNIPILVENNIVGVYGVARDITAKRQAEMDIKLAKTQLESFIDNNVDSILIFDKEGRVVKVNDSFTSTFGWTSKEALGVYHLDLAIIPKEDRESVSRNLQILKGGQTFKGYQTKRVKKSGGTIDVDISGFPIHNSKGEVDGWAITFRDISEAKAAEEVLRNSEKLTIAGQLAAGIAHEIRNPMTAIKGFIQLLNKEFPHRKNYFEIIIDEISRIELIISELLFLAKPQEIKYERTDIHNLLDDVILLLETQAILNNVEIKLDLKLSEKEVIGERNQLKQVCINFMKNSIEAMPNGGQLTIKTIENENKGAVIQFCDNGHGIPSSVLKRLGEPFFTTKEKGTGLGFMISKRIIEAHGGSLQVYNGKSGGATIEIFLPFKADLEDPTILTDYRHGGMCFNDKEKLHLCGNKNK